MLNQLIQSSWLYFSPSSVVVGNIANALEAFMMTMMMMMMMMTAMTTTTMMMMMMVVVVLIWLQLQLFLLLLWMPQWVDSVWLAFVTVIEAVTSWMIEFHYSYSFP